MTTALSVDDLADQIATLAAHLDAATHTLMTHVREFDTRDGWARQGAKSCAHWLSWRIGLDIGAAREQVRVAHRLGELPVVDEAFRTGSISYSKVRAITRVANTETQQILVDLARHTSGAELEIACRKYRSVQPQNPKDEPDRRYVRRRNLDDGMVKVDIALRADEAALLFAVLDKLAAREANPENVSAEIGSPYGDVKRLRPKTFDRADALMALVNSAARGDSPDRTPVELIVVVGRDLPAETCERLACDAGVVEVTVDATGNPLDVGRKYRTVHPLLKRALAVRDPVCQFPGCANRLFLDAHHIEHWQHGGETKLDNLVRTCTFHHDLLHTGFTCAIVDGKPEFRDPDGRPIAIVPHAPRPTRGGIDVLAEAHADLAIDEITNAPLGTRAPNYRAIVDDCISEEEREDREWLAGLSGGRLDGVVDEWTLLARAKANG